LRRAKDALADSEKRFRSLLESLPSLAVQGYDARRRVFFWNAASEHLYGYSRSEALGRRIEELILPPALHSWAISAIDAWVAGGAAIPHGELTLMRKDGSPVKVHSSHVMQINAQGEREMFCIDVGRPAVENPEG
jgi:PAS domain S-box-containing protein